MASNPSSTTKIAHLHESINYLKQAISIAKARKPRYHARRMAFMKKCQRAAVPEWYPTAPVPAHAERKWSYENWNVATDGILDIERKKRCAIKELEELLTRCRTELEDSSKEEQLSAVDEARVGDVGGGAEASDT